MIRELHARSLALLGVLFLVGGVATAQPTLTGVRATITGADWTGTVDLDVTLYTTPVPGQPTFTTGFLGDRYSGSGTFLGATTLFTYQILDPSVRAIEWGDGESLDHAKIPLVSSGPPRIYRGSFSHTYPDTSSDYTIRVGAHGLMGYPDAGGYDNPRLPPVTGDALYVDSVRSHYVLDYVGSGTNSGTGTFVFEQPQAVAITNTVVAAASLFPDPPPIPTSSRWGLVALAFVMATGGALLLRR